MPDGPLDGSAMREAEQRILDRMRELEPMVNEYFELREVAETFERVRGHPAGAKPNRSLRSNAVDRPQPPGRRAEQALAMVRERPGITVAELAAAMSIGTTYLYRVMPALERQGLVRKVGQGYEPAGSNAETVAEDAEQPTAAAVPSAAGDELS